MAKVFVSYSRDSAAVVRQLVTDLEELGHSAWFDQELSGGQAWWDQILASIRDCSVMLFVLHPKSLSSVACARERGYAHALGKPVLPVQVAETLSINLLPPNLAQLQIVRYFTGSTAEVKSLARGIGSLPPASPLPDPLPSAPEVPASYLGAVAMRIDSAEGLGFQEQSALLVELRGALRDVETRVDADVLLGRLRKRRDLFAAIAEEIDGLRERTLAPEVRPPARVEIERTTTPSVATPVVAPESGPKPQAEMKPGLWWTLRPAAAGMIIGLFVMLFAFTVIAGRSDFGTYVAAGLFSAVLGFLTGLMARRDRLGWALAAIGFLIGTLTMPWSTSYKQADALIIGGLLGAAVGALIGLLWRRIRKPTQPSTGR